MIVEDLSRSRATHAATNSRSMSLGKHDIISGSLTTEQPAPRIATYAANLRVVLAYRTEGPIKPTCSRSALLSPHFRRVRRANQ
jgi:hypothetical protein